jgi:hypothetical protein
MKLSWGTGIAIFYSLFVLVLLGFVFASTKQDHSLVSDTYYQEDLHYQHKMENIQRTSQLDHAFELTINQHPSAISINIPKELAHFKGKMTLFHPAYASLDQTYQIEKKTINPLVVPVRKLIKGRWLVKIEGENDGKQYFHETYLMAP